MELIVFVIQVSLEIEISAKAVINLVANVQAHKQINANLVLMYLQSSKMDFVQRTAHVILVSIQEIHRVLNALIIVLFVMIYSNVKLVQLDIKLIKLKYKDKLFKHVHRYVEMELNIKLNAMMEIAKMEMDVVVLVLYKQDGHVVVGLLLKNQTVRSLFLIKLFCHPKVQLIWEIRLFKVLELHIYPLV